MWLEIESWLAMDTGLATELGILAKLKPQQLYQIFESESPRRYSLTKDLLDVLYNLCVVESIETGDRQKQVLERHLPTIKKLLSKKTPLATKKQLLQADAQLVTALAETCRLNA